MDTPASTDDSNGASNSAAAPTWVPHAPTTAPGIAVRSELAALDRGELIGRYLILARIGQGGMGVVYAAHDPELDRKVALKLLLVGSDDATIARDLRTRLLREAQALAQLAHPCVVTVHDVGTHGDRVWIAMEFIDGVTLTTWLQQPRPWPEVVAVLRRAGEGLAAAHAAGLVHRDFKPDNVMVSADGRVRVMDFGLARAERASAPAPRDLRASGSALQMAVTQAGAVMGTPQYMAPEQWLGAETDARTDQFAFCVTLWQALYRQHPYADSLTALAMTVTEGRRREPPGRAAVPSWLRDVALRGLATSADARWPSMTQLLAALRGGAARRRRRLALAGSLVVGLALGGLAVRERVVHTRQVAACEAAGVAARAMWSDDARDGLRASLLATRVPYAAMTFDHLAPLLDRFAAAWGDAGTQLCLRHAVSGELDAATAERGHECLLAARWSFEAMLEVLAEGDPGSVQPAVNAAARLPTPTDCLDPTWLAHRSQLPRDESMRHEVLGVRRDLERARASTATGRYDQAAGWARALVVRADATGWRPLAAQARALAGELADRSGQSARGERLLEDGLHLAAELGEDGIVADAATTLTDVVGDNLARFDEGLRWGRLAGAVIRRLGEEDGTRGAKLAGALAGVYEARGQFDRAEPFAARALALWEKLLGADNPSVAQSLNNLAIIRYNLDRKAEATQMLERSLALTESALGSSHPNVAAMLNNLGNIRLTDEEYEAAQQLFERALQIREAGVGRDHPSLGISLINLAGVALSSGDYDAAERHSVRAHALFERNVGPGHPDVAAAIENLALVHRARGDLEAALMVQTRSLAIRERRLGRDHPERAIGLHNLGDIQRARGELAAAERSYAAALAVYERNNGPTDVTVVGPLCGLAEVALLRGQRERAVELLTRAVGVGEAGAAPPRVLADARFALARALHASDPAGARALALRAAAGIRGADVVAQTKRGEIDRWLVATAAPP